MLSARPGRQVGGAPGSKPWNALAGGRRGREGRRRLPCFSSGRTEKRFAGVGLPATSGDHRACWSPASAGGSLEFVRPLGGGRRPSVRPGCALFWLRWSWATSVPEKVCFLPLPFRASELGQFSSSCVPSAVASPRGVQELREAQPGDSVASPASS